MIKGNSFAFWAYDLFPYVIGGEIQPDIEVKNGVPKAYSPTYGGYVHVRHQMSYEDGALIRDQLKALVEVRDAELAAVYKKFKAAALDVAPFLKDFPAYKKD